MIEQAGCKLYKSEHSPGSTKLFFFCTLPLGSVENPKKQILKPFLSEQLFKAENHHCQILYRKETNSFGNCSVFYGKLNTFVESHMWA